MASSMAMRTTAGIFAPLPLLVPTSLISHTGSAHHTDRELVVHIPATGAVLHGGHRPRYRGLAVLLRWAATGST
jgi:hypothetical protein